MSDEVKDDKADSPEEEKKESDAEKEAEAKKAKMEADYAEMQKSMKDMTAQLEAIQKERDDFKSKYEAALLAHKTAELKSKLVGSVVDEAEFDADKEMYLAMSDKAVEKLIAVANKKPVSEQIRINAAETTVAGDGAGKLF